MKAIFRILGTAAAVAATGAAIVIMDKFLNEKAAPIIESIEFPEEAEKDDAEAAKTAEAYAEGEAKVEAEAAALAGAEIDDPRTVGLGTRDNPVHRTGNAEHGVVEEVVAALPVDAGGGGVVGVGAQMPLDAQRAVLLGEQLPLRLRAASDRMPPVHAKLRTVYIEMDCGPG